METGLEEHQEMETTHEELHQPESDPEELQGSGPALKELLESGTVQNKPQGLEMGLEEFRAQQVCFEMFHFF